MSKLRNKSEELIIKKCLINNILIIGVCRGKQYKNTYFGGKLKLIKNQAVSHKHKIYNKSKYNFPIKVNTFHNYGIPFRYNSKFTKILAVDDEKNVEAFIHLKKKILGIMWHPEREKDLKNKILIYLGVFFVTDIVILAAGKGSRLYPFTKNLQNVCWILKVNQF